MDTYIYNMRLTNLPLVHTCHSQKISTGLISASTVLVVLINNDEERPNPLIRYMVAIGLRLRRSPSIAPRTQFVFDILHPLDDR